MSESWRRRMAIWGAVIPKILEQQADILGASGLVFSFIVTAMIVPFSSERRAPSAGGFPAMPEVAFLVKDLVLLAVFIYLLQLNVVRVVRTAQCAAI